MITNRDKHDAYLLEKMQSAMANNNYKHALSILKNSDIKWPKPEVAEQLLEQLILSACVHENILEVQYVIEYAKRHHFKLNLDRAVAEIESNDNDKSKIHGPQNSLFFAFATTNHKVAALLLSAGATFSLPKETSEFTLQNIIIDLLKYPNCNDILSDIVNKLIEIKFRFTDSTCKEILRAVCVMDFSPTITTMIRYLNAIELHFSFEQNDTLLRIAISNGNVETIQFLATKGAFLTSLDDDSRNEFYIQKSLEDADLLFPLVKHGGFFSTKPTDYLEICRRLLQTSTNDLAPNLNRTVIDKNALILVYAIIAEKMFYEETAINDLSVLYKSSHYLELSRIKLICLNQLLSNNVGLVNSMQTSFDELKLNPLFSKIMAETKLEDMLISIEKDFLNRSTITDDENDLYRWGKIYQELNFNRTAYDRFSKCRTIPASIQAANLLLQDKEIKQNVSLAWGHFQQVIKMDTKEEHKDTLLKLLKDIEDKAELATDNADIAYQIGRYYADNYKHTKDNSRRIEAKKWLMLSIGRHAEPRANLLRLELACDDEDEFRHLVIDKISLASEIGKDLLSILENNKKPWVTLYVIKQFIVTETNLISVKQLQKAFDLAKADYQPAIEWLKKFLADLTISRDFDRKGELSTLLLHYHPTLTAQLIDLIVPFLITNFKSSDQLSQHRGYDTLAELGKDHELAATELLRELKRADKPDLLAKYFINMPIRDVSHEIEWELLQNKKVHIHIDEKAFLRLLTTHHDNLIANHSLSLSLCLTRPSAVKQLLVHSFRHFFVGMKIDEHSTDFHPDLSLLANEGKNTIQFIFSCLHYVTGDNNKTSVEINTGLVFFLETSTISPLFITNAWNKVDKNTSPDRQIIVYLEKLVEWDNDQHKLTNLFVKRVSPFTHFLTVFKNLPVTDNLAACLLQLNDVFQIKMDTLEEGQKKMLGAAIGFGARQLLDEWGIKYRLEKNKEVKFN